jgi:hypothetical protein
MLLIEHHCFIVITFVATLPYSIRMKKNKFPELFLALANSKEANNADLILKTDDIKVKK